MHRAEIFFRELFSCGSGSRNQCRSESESAQFGGSDAEPDRPRHRRRPRGRRGLLPRTVVGDQRPIGRAPDRSIRPVGRDARGTAGRPRRSPSRAVPWPSALAWRPALASRSALARWVALARPAVGVPSRPLAPRLPGCRRLSRRELLAVALWPPRMGLRPQGRLGRGRPALAALARRLSLSCEIRPLARRAPPLGAPRPKAWSAPLIRGSLVPVGTVPLGGPVGWGCSGRLARTARTAPVEGGLRHAGPRGIG